MKYRVALYGDGKYRIDMCVKTNNLAVNGSLLFTEDEWETLDEYDFEKYALARLDELVEEQKRLAEQRRLVRVVKEVKI